MRIAVVGAGRIGGNVARRLAAAGHGVTLSFSRDPARLQALAQKIGATAAEPGEAVAGAEVVVVSVPWGALEAALEQAGPLEGRIVVDTTNQFGPGAEPAAGETAAAFNAARMPGARYTKCFNTLTAAFQAEAADRDARTRVVQWLCGDDADAKATSPGLSSRRATSRSTSAGRRSARSWRRLGARGRCTERSTGRRRRRR